VVLIGCGATAGAVVLGGIAALGWLLTAFSDAEGLSLRVHGPAEVVVGQTFDLVLSVTNERKKDISLSQVLVEDEHLDGFLLIDFKPPSRGSSRNAFTKDYVFDVDPVVPGGKTQVFTLTLRALRPGLFRGEVSVWEGNHPVKQLVHTSVKDAPASAPATQPRPPD
jgi:hypothetical protein